MALRLESEKLMSGSIKLTPLGVFNLLSELAVEGNIAFHVLAAPFVKGLASVEGRAVDMETDGRLAVGSVIDAVQT